MPSRFYLTWIAINTRKSLIGDLREKNRQVMMFSQLHFCIPVSGKNILFE